MKVKYGLKNAYYALATISTSDSTVTYGTPVRLQGAVSMSMAPAGENTSFYADDQVFFTTGGNIGYTGTLELALIPDSFLKDCLGETQATTGVLVEESDAAPKPFALLFEFTTDENAVKHVFYNCTATRPNIDGQTKGESTDVKTETLNITASPVYNATVAGNIVKAKADSTATTIYNNWYTTVYQP